MTEQVLGPEHPDTLNSRNNLAAAYAGVGRYEEAIELHQGTLKLMEQVLGPEHPTPALVVVLTTIPTRVTRRSPSGFNLGDFLNTGHQLKEATSIFLW